MKNRMKLLSALLALVMLLAAFAACNGGEVWSPTGKETPSKATEETPTAAQTTVSASPTQEQPSDLVDYVGSLKLDMSSSSKKLEVTVKTYVDGDTTHFNVPEDVIESGVLKARYLAVNTPESTGKIEKWGKQASNFTKEHLKGASSIIVESDDENWNTDSTGSRYLVWVWYKTEGQNEYRNLNLELLQNGLAIASNSGQNRYGDICMNAIMQAKKAQLHVHGNEKDPLFYEGAIQEVTLKALRTDPESYKDTLVSFDAVIVREYSNTLYVEEYDEEDGIYYGITAYYGFSADPDLLAIMKLGNRIRIVGSMQYYEAGGTWQVSGLKYNVRKPNESCGLIETGVETDYVLTDPARFEGGKMSVPVQIKDEDGGTMEIMKEFPYAQLVMSTSLMMTDLKVTSVYTTTNDASSSKGAMTLTCKAPDGTTVDVRTVVLKDDAGNLITADAYEGRTIDVKAIVDYYEGYQLKVFTDKDITVKN
ncbi:MAG: thermonuclease family protein [Clostridia bacterium]|nr:thermonuclease family protein [Clostridia bacterium]